MMQQTMLRVKDPVKSLDFYTRILGMTWVLAWASLQWTLNKLLFLLAANNSQKVTQWILNISELFFGCVCVNYWDCVLNINWIWLFSPVCNIFQAPAKVWLPLHAFLSLLLGLRGQEGDSDRCEGKDGLDLFQKGHHWADTVRVYVLELVWSIEKQNLFSCTIDLLFPARVTFCG